MTEKVVLIIVAGIAIAAYLNINKVKKRLDTLEIVLAKKNLLTWNDPAWKLTSEDKKLLDELSK